jgi:selenide,water dikinase
MEIKLTQYSHGAGCGCKISPKVLDKILTSKLPKFSHPNLIVGNESRDDAAVFDLGDGSAVISTTDFFMPIVDDPFDFGRVAATNAISDVYAMGGKPIMAIAILGWPIDKLSPEVASLVIDGARSVCADANICLAGGHSIDAPEPIFGLAVTGTVALEQLKRNDEAKVGDYLMLTKPLGVGILTTAEKRGILRDQDINLARDNMVKLNDIGAKLAPLVGVHAMTDVTGFGLMGHLVEVCEGSGVHADIHFNQVPLLSDLQHYLDQQCVPGGSGRNFESYGHKLGVLTDDQLNILCDPQTSGGLLVSVAEDAIEEVEALCAASGHECAWVGRIKAVDTMQAHCVSVV